MQIFFKPIRQLLISIEDNQLTLCFQNFKVEAYPLDLLIQVQLSQVEGNLQRLELLRTRLEHVQTCWY
jgi:hypothetical protein